MSAIRRVDAGFWREGHPAYLAERADAPGELWGVSPALEQIEQTLLALSQHWRDAATFSPLPERERFEKLADAWTERTQFMSSVQDMVMDQKYQEIIGMGPVATKWILDRLARQPDYWFWALRAITGVDPVPEDDCGDLDAMARHWLRWGTRIL